MPIWTPPAVRHEVDRSTSVLKSPREDYLMADERKGAVTLRGNPITLGGPEIKAGQSAPDFTALDNGLKPVKLSEAKGKVIILSSVPSLDTPTCDTETRRFNQEASKLGGNVEVWTISRY